VAGGVDATFRDAGAFNSFDANRTINAGGRVSFWSASNTFGRITRENGQICRA
jgi:hypothetical protein